MPGSDTHLTARECEILELVAEDLTNAGIAARLGLKESTVGHHLEQVYRKLGVGSRAGAVAWYLRNGRGQGGDE